MQNKAKFRKVKLNVNRVLTNDYVQMDTWSIGKTKPIQSQSKPIQSQLKPILCQNKPNSNPNKANSMPFKLAFLRPFFTVKWLVDEKHIIEEGKYGRTE
jgi:hypothetical protein